MNRIEINTIRTEKDSTDYKFVASLCESNAKDCVVVYVTHKHTDEVVNGVIGHKDNIHKFDNFEICKIGGEISFDNFISSIMERQIDKNVIFVADTDIFEFSKTRHCDSLLYSLKSHMKINQNFIWFLGNSIPARSISRYIEFKNYSFCVECRNLNSIGVCLYCRNNKDTPK